LLEKDGLKIQSQERIAGQKNQVDLLKTRMDNETKITVAELSAKVDRMQLFLEERARLGTQQHDSALAAAEAGHAQQMAQIGHEQQLQASAMQAGTQAGAGAGQAEQAHRQALEQGAAGHQQALEQQTQAAALVPQPEAGEA